MENLMDAQEVARELDVSVQAVHRLCHRGTLASFFLAGRRLFRREVVDAYLADARAQARRRVRGWVEEGKITPEFGERVIEAGERRARERREGKR